ncbi:MAG: sulfur-oxidizing protein SoxX [Saprospiraceae bacterium]|jgi:sulfur-oxidizing protein SoxX
MRANRILSLVATALLIGASASFSSLSIADTLPTEKGCKKVADPSEVIQGWCLAITRKKGNCLACHNMVVTGWPKDLATGGNIAPPLVAMKARFPDKEKLRAQIYDATAKNPDSMMPPFGAHGILNDKQIDKIVNFLLTI